MGKRTAARSRLTAISFVCLSFAGLFAFTQVRGDEPNPAFRPTYGPLSYEDPADQDIEAEEPDPSEIEHLTGEGIDWPDTPNSGVSGD